jgi:hypothetical protein
VTVVAVFLPRDSWKSRLYVTFHHSIGDKPSDMICVSYRNLLETANFGKKCSSSDTAKTWDRGVTGVRIQYNPLYMVMFPRRAFVGWDEVENGSSGEGAFTGNC